MKTKVIFRKDKRDGEVIAFFPEFLGTLEPDTMVCYSPIGQHGTATEAYYYEDTVPLDWQDGDKGLQLYQELTVHCGYTDVQVCKRISHKMRETRIKEFGNL